MDEDAIDRVVASWHRERPDLDLAAVGLLGRFGRLAVIAGRRVEEVFPRHGLRSGEFDVLATLRRSGQPYALTPSAMSATLMLSRAGMTNRIDRLEEAGMVERQLDPADRRSFLIALTQVGRETVDAAMTEHTANETRLVSSLTHTERQTLDTLLRKLLQSLDDEPLDH
ncbi:MarR family winged helix-turn-helix transcriptional regulator [Fodinicola feengrottensis]